jgi:hypothetical protein
LQLTDVVGDGIWFIPCRISPAFAAGSDPRPVRFDVTKHWLNDDFA